MLLVPAGGGCSGNGMQGVGDSGAGLDATAMMDAAAPIDLAMEAPHPVPPAPQVISQGGPVLANPKIQLIAYASDATVSDVEAFIKEFGATTEWASQTSEYGVGPFTQLPTILIPGMPPTRLDDDWVGAPFQQTLVSSISGLNPAWPPEDGSTIYLFLLPLGTDIHSGGHCCTDFLGYHYEAALPKGGAPYAVACHCPAQQGDALTPLQFITTTVSHELVEGATNPFTESNPGYARSNDADAIWTVATGGELADMCENHTDSNCQPPRSKYMIQRSWSNAAAKAGKNPCVPVANADPYFNSYPILSDPITLHYYGPPWSTTGVSLAEGETRTIDVVLSSQGATAGRWHVKAWDLVDYLGYGKPNTTLSLDRSSGSNGDVLHLTIKVNSYNQGIGGAGFVLESTLNGQDNLTFGAIGQ